MVHSEGEFSGEFGDKTPLGPFETPSLNLLYENRRICNEEWWGWTRTLDLLFLNWEGGSQTLKWNEPTSPTGTSSKLRVFRNFIRTLQFAPCLQLWNGDLTHQNIGILVQLHCMVQQKLSSDVVILCISLVVTCLDTSSQSCMFLPKSRKQQMFSSSFGQVL